MIRELLLSDREISLQDRWVIRPILKPAPLRFYIDSLDSSCFNGKAIFIGIYSFLWIYRSRMKNTKLILLTLSALLLVLQLAACQSKKINYTYITTDSAPVTEVDKNTQAQLAQAAVSIDKSLQELSAIKIATNPQVRLSAPVNPKQLGMEQISSISWNGPIEPLLEKIAAAGHYRLKVLGVAPAVPILIAVNAQNEPLADILRDVTFQAQNKAGIVVYPGKSAAGRVIELRYY